MPAPPLLALRDIALTFGGTPLLDGATLAVGAGDRVALVGRNGSGKSTLLRIAAGAVAPDAGERFLQPGATVRYLPQEPDLSGFGTALAYVEAGLGPGQDPYRARYLLGELGLSGDEDPARLSGGEARRAALARVLAPEPDVLLLDEPTNHLDLPAIEWLEAELSGLRSALVVISHDRRFLTALSRGTVWLDRGRTRALDRGFEGFEAWRDKLLEEEEDARHKLDRRIAREEHWLRYGVTARRKRNVGRLERLASLRAEKRAARGPVGDVSIAVSEGRASGQIVIDAKGISKRFGDREIVGDVSIRVLRGDRVAVVGPNGAGKTTLISLLTGALAPDAGTVRLGSNLQIASLDQRRARLDPAIPLRDALTGGGSDTVTINGEGRHVIGYMKDFLFTPEQAGTPVGRLSGGERARVALARALALPSNLLVLDEPTNDLDLETLDLLQETVADYPGTVILVSHDRDFIDRVATMVIASEGEGRWVAYAGGYADMQAQRRAGTAAAPVAPKTSAAGIAPPAAARPGGRKKLSFNQSHALRTLPGRIEALGRELDALRETLADPGLYARDPQGFARASARHAEAEAERGRLEDEWLELEMLREQMEGDA